MLTKIYKGKSTEEHNLNAQFIMLDEKLIKIKFNEINKGSRQLNISCRSRLQRKCNKHTIF